MRLHQVLKNLTVETKFYFSENFVFLGHIEKEL